MYDFDKIIDRRNTASLKWDVAENELPMWVADMDFQTAPEITNAIKQRAEHGIFGYSVRANVSDEWYKAYIDWWEKRHHYAMKKSSLMFCIGVMPAISSIIRHLTGSGEKILVQTPVYNCFFKCILNNDRIAVQNELIYDGENYSIDFSDLEEKLSDPETTLMLFCNPHNPVGKIWSKEEIEKIGELCAKYNVTVISDEVHCDLTDPDCEYVPFASVSDICRDISITCIAPTKAFNIAGLKTSAVSVPNGALRTLVKNALETDELAEPNAFAIDAAVAAFTEGEAWLDELRNYIFDNKKTVSGFLSKELPHVKLVPSKATYLLWLDCSYYSTDSKVLSSQIRRETGLFLTSGRAYGENGNGFLRMNIACPRAMLLDGLNRLKTALSWKNN